MITTLTFDVTFDEHHADPQTLASALDSLMQSALNTGCGLLEYGHVSVGSIAVQSLTNPHVTVHDSDSKEVTSSIPLSTQELATVLAALRYWQQDLVANAGHGDGPISAEHFVDAVPLTAHEIDELCMRFNC